MSSAGGQPAAKRSKATTAQLAASVARLETQLAELIERTAAEGEKRRQEETERREKDEKRREEDEKRREEEAKRTRATLDELVRSMKGKPAKRAPAEKTVTIVARAVEVITCDFTEHWHANMQNHASAAMAKLMTKLKETLPSAVPSERDRLFKDKRKAVLKKINQDKTNHQRLFARGKIMADLETLDTVELCKSLMCTMLCKSASVLTAIDDMAVYCARFAFVFFLTLQKVGRGGRVFDEMLFQTQIIKLFYPVTEPSAVSMALPNCMQHKDHFTNEMRYRRMLPSVPPGDEHGHLPAGERVYLSLTHALEQLSPANHTKLKPLVDWVAPDSRAAAKDQLLAALRLAAGKNTGNLPIYRATAASDDADSDADSGGSASAAAAET